MPLRCKKNDADIFALDYANNVEWEQLREVNSVSKDLFMPCCGANVVLRTSTLGTRFFAHARKGPCVTAPETAEHLLAKQHIFEAVRQTEWAAIIEQCGATPAGAEWKADVLASKNKCKIAFEVQWSRQTIEETLLRQERYRESGVRGLWLFRQVDFPFSKEVPAFLLSFNEADGNFSVTLPSSNYHPEFVRRRRSAEVGGYHWGNSVPLRQFIVGALGGKLHYGPQAGRRMPLVVETAQTNCWKCKKLTNIITGLVFSSSRVTTGSPDVHLDIHTFNEGVPNGAAELMQMLPANLLKGHGIGSLKPRYSRTEGGQYLSNGCVHCDALQGRFFEHEYAFDSIEAFSVEVEFRQEWTEGLIEAGSFTPTWWFDES